MMLHGKTAFISGAASGIGHACAAHFLQQGIQQLYVLDYNARPLEQAIACWTQQYPDCQITPLIADIGQFEQLQEIAHRLQQQQVAVDILVNSAGVSDENQPDDLVTFQRVLQINLMGTCQLTSLLLPLLNDNGRIINVASILAKAGKMRNTAYCTAKHGILGFTKSLALDVADRKITVNALLPGWIDTPMLRHEIAKQAELIGADANKLLRSARKNMPIKRLIQAEEAAHSIAFLASDAAGGITAQSLVLDGGYTCGM